MNLNTIRSEGALVPADLLEEVHTGSAPGQRAADFGLNGKVRLIDEIAAAWSDAKAYWEALQHGLRRLKADESGASVTREQWVLPLLRTLGFEGVTFSRSATTVGGRSYSISHRLGDGEHPLPIHIEGARFEIDKRTPTGRPRISPHALVQEYLNRTDALWGIVTNGYQFRILRDSARLSRPTYLEFDLRQMMEGEHFTDFQLFYRIVHRTRWPRDTESAHECLLEQYYQHGIETGGRVRERLRDGVEKALKILGNGFLDHPKNAELLEKIKEERLPASEYYRQLLRLIYRLLFLMVSEERKLVGPDPQNDLLYAVYTQHYSINRLRDKVERPINPQDRYWDLWEGVKQNFRLYCEPRAVETMGVALLNGDLFGPDAMRDLDAACLLNRHFLYGFAHLSLFKEQKVTKRINYGYLDVEELGSVYESLLEYHPVFKDVGGQVKFDLAFGTERKSTGSYYTRPELVQELIKSALVPVLEERLEKAQTREEKEQALLSLKVCDPAAGSGHFLLAAARRIGTELAKVRSGEEQPTPSEFRLAVRDVIQHCIYGVDLNPLAVDLCKVALWLEGHSRGYPLTFLDHRIKCGNSLVGIDTLDRLNEGIPDDAFKPVTGDDKDVAKRVKADNKRERKAWEDGQLPLENLDEQFKADLQSFAAEIKNIDEIEEREADDVGRKQAEYEKVRTGERWLRDRNAANIWTAAFFYPLTDVRDQAIPTQGRLVGYLAKPKATHGQLVGKANGLAAKLRFFHWPLEFPDVAEAGGFDVVLGNPPWDRVKLEEKEFFLTRAPEIAEAPSQAVRRKLISELSEINPPLLQEFEEAKHDAESVSRFIRQSGKYSLTAVGDLNTYQLFAELSWRIRNSDGRAGIIVPTGIVSDDSLKHFFNSLYNSENLISMIGFINSKKIFLAIKDYIKFGLFTIGKSQKPSFMFLLTDVSQIEDERRRFTLTKNELELLNPNTTTCPIFRVKYDAELTKKIYTDSQVLVNDRLNKNLWGVRFFSMFHMSSDSNLFHPEPDDSRLPLYEAKMIHQFDHRFATFEKATEANINEGNLPQLTPEMHSVPNYYSLPRYWVDRDATAERLRDVTPKDYLIGFRDITGNASERTAIFSILPKYAVGNSLPLLLSNIENDKLICCLFGCLNSITFDFVTRLKISGSHMNFYIVKQLPVLPPERYGKEHIEFICARVLELVYTAYDVKAFAESMGYGGPPFKWDEERRALLRAELDAYYAKLYDLNRDELRYILDPHDVYGPDFPGETFRVLKEKEIRQYGEYRTRRLVLEAWDRLFGEK